MGRGGTDRLGDPQGSRSKRTGPGIRVVAALAVGLLAAALAGGGVASGQAPGSGTRTDVAVEAPRPLTTDPNPIRLFATPAVAVHPDDPSTVVVAVGDARNGGCGLVVSTDGGLSWRQTESLMPAELPMCIQRNFGPYVAPAFASNGRLYVGVSGSSPRTGHPNGPIDGLVVVTDDLGTTHEVFTAASSAGFTYTPPDGGTMIEGFNQWRIPSLAVDPGDPDRVYIGWRLWNDAGDVSFTNFPQRSYVASSGDGGRTWTEPLDLIAATFGDRAEELGLVLDGSGQTHADTPSMVVASDGTVYAFTKERPPRAPAGEPAPNSRLFMFRSSDNGNTWEGTIFNEGNQSNDSPTAAIDGDDNLYVVYAARGANAPQGEPPNPSEVYFQRSTDGGDTWSEPINLTDDDPVGGFDQFFPGISVAPNGRIDVAWYDFRNDPFFSPGEAGNMGTAVGERYWDVYHTYSTDGGLTWSQNLRVTDRSIDGDVGVTFSRNDVRGPMGIASTDEAAYVAWADSRVGGPEQDAQDAFFTRVRFAEPLALGASTSSGSPLAWAGLGAGVALAVAGIGLLAMRTRPTPTEAVRR